MKARESFLTAPGIFPDALPSLRREVAVVVVITAGVAFLSARFELGEAFYAFTRRWESLQLDEWPTVALALSLCLIWLVRRRYRQALVQLTARRKAEMELAAALAENRRLAAEHLRVQESERKHLARELHDELGQYTNAIKLDASAIRNAAPGTPAIDASERILKAVDHMHAVTGSIIRRLRPAGLDELGLVAALEHCVEQWQRRLPDTRLHLTVSDDVTGMDEVTTLTLYRLVQEGLTNSFRHARARSIEVRLTPVAGDHDRVTLTISDDGRGADPGRQTNGFGLSGMRERVELLGGTFRTRSTPGKGFTLEATLPTADRRPTGIAS